jgi:hypothetical protein
MSGYSSEFGGAADLDEDEHTLPLQKPFTEQTLLEHVWGALHPSTTTVRE